MKTDNRPQDSDIRLQVVEFDYPSQGITVHFQEMQAIHNAVLHLSGILGVPFRLVRSVDIRHEEEAMERKMRRANGFYNIPTDEVYLVIDNLKSVEAAEHTYLHEVVGHKGLRAVLGEKTFKTLCKSVYRSMPRTTQITYLRKYRNPIIAGEEYLAHVAEQGAPASVWSSITAALKVALNSVGIVVNYRDNEVRALLQKSRQHLLKEKEKKLTEHKKKVKHGLGL